MGDGEIQEGSVWEAAMFAAHNHLNNLVAMVDCNSYGQSNNLGHDKDTLDSYKRKFEAFGWTAVTLNGHDMPSIIEALER